MKRIIAAGALIGLLCAPAAALQKSNPHTTVDVPNATPIPLPTDSNAPNPLRSPLDGPNADYIEANAFLALARGTLQTCADANNPALSAAQAQYALAEKAAKAHNIVAVRTNARAAIDLCATTPAPQVQPSP
jgi:hypothetical protein